MAALGTHGIPASLRDVAIRSDDPRYPGVRSTYIRGGAPDLVLQPRTTGEVVDARARPVPLSIRSGSHGISGRSTNHGRTVIDLSRLDVSVFLQQELHLYRADIGDGGDMAHVTDPR